MDQPNQRRGEERGGDIMSVTFLLAVYQFVICSFS